MQRSFRDVHSGVHHVQMAREGTMSNYGESALNLPYKFHFLRDNVDPALCLI